MKLTPHFFHLLKKGEVIVSKSRGMELVKSGEFDDNTKFRLSKWI